MALKAELYNAAIAVLGLDEGNRRKPYKDSRGYWTIGIGHLIGASLTELEVSTDVVQVMFQEDLIDHWKECELFFGEQFLESISLARQVALLSLMFNLGKVKLSKFIKTVPLIREQKWEEAGRALLETKWARDVDPGQRPNEGRDDRIAFMIMTGEFHADYGIVDSVRGDGILRVAATAG